MAMFTTETATLGLQQKIITTFNHFTAHHIPSAIT